MVKLNYLSILVHLCYARFFPGYEDLTQQDSKCFRDNWIMGLPNSMSCLPHRKMLLLPWPWYHIYLKQLAASPYSGRSSNSPLLLPLHRLLIHSCDVNNFPETHTMVHSLDCDVKKVMDWVISTAWKRSKYEVVSGPYFPAFGLNTERYGVSLFIQSKCGKIHTTKNSVSGHFSRSVCVQIKIFAVNSKGIPFER